MQHKPTGNRTNSTSQSFERRELIVRARKPPTRPPVEPLVEFSPPAPTGAVLDLVRKTMIHLGWLRLYCAIVLRN